MDSRWSYWINEPIFMDGGVMNIVKRKHAMYIFCKEGLIPMLKSSGYTFAMNDSLLVKQILQLCFALSKGHTVLPKEQQCAYMEEQYDYYNYLFSTQRWEKFWKRWGNMQDFQEGHYGYYLRYTFSDFVWSWLNIDASSTAIALEQELDAQHDYDEFTKGKDDPYLQETSTRDYQDRHWH